MKVSEKQLQLMLRVLQGSIAINTSYVTDYNTGVFGIDLKTRKKLYDSIIEQMSDDIVDVKEKEEVIETIDFK